LEKNIKDVTSSFTNQSLLEMILKLKEENKKVLTRVNAFKTGGIKLISE